MSLYDILCLIAVKRNGTQCCILQCPTCQINQATKCGTLKEVSLRRGLFAFFGAQLMLWRVSYWKHFMSNFHIEVIFGEKLPVLLNSEFLNISIFNDGKRVKCLRGSTLPSNGKCTRAYTSVHLSVLVPK